MTKAKQMTDEPVMLSREQWVDVSAKLTRLAQYDDKLSAVMPSDYKDWHENSRGEWPEVAAHAITNLRKQRDQAENELEINRAKVAELEEERDDAVHCHKTSDEHRSAWQQRAVAAEAELVLLKDANRALFLSAQHCNSCGYLLPEHSKDCGRYPEVIAGLQSQLTSLREGLEKLSGKWKAEYARVVKEDGPVWRAAANELQSLLTQTDSSVNKE